MLKVGTTSTLTSAKVGTTSTQVPNIRTIARANGQHNTTEQHTAVPNKPLVHKKETMGIPQRVKNLRKEAYGLWSMHHTPNPFDSIRAAKGGSQF